MASSADYKRVLELDPSQSVARQAVMVCYSSFDCLEDGTFGELYCNRSA